jgi:hypothetical protein
MVARLGRKMTNASGRLGIMRNAYAAIRSGDSLVALARIADDGRAVTGVTSLQGALTASAESRSSHSMLVINVQDGARAGLAVSVDS